MTIRDDDAPAYYLDGPDIRNVHAVKTMLALARMPSMRGHEGPYWRCAGQHLARLKHTRSRDEWEEIVRGEFGLSPSRAYELLQLGADTKTIGQARSQAAARARKSRKKRKITVVTAL